MKILVLAGGSDQIALIKELKKYSYEIILVDYFQNPPAKQYADKHIVASTLDIEAVTKIAKDEHVDLIVTACTDQALLTMAKVSEDLSLPCYISYKTALNVTNKSYMKKVMFQNNIPTSKYRIIDSSDFNDEYLYDFSFPLVVKPVDCNSSKGVKKVYTRDEAIKAIKSATDLSRTKTAVIEEFKEGLEISVDCFVKDGDVKLLSITNSTKIKSDESFTILQSLYPIVNNIQEQEILRIAKNIARSFDLNNTPMLIQMIMNSDGFYVLEFSARIGGGSKYKLIEVISGVNIMKVYVDLLLGNNIDIIPKKCVEYASMNYVYCYNGILKEICNLNKLKDDKIINEYFIYKSLGTQIDKALTSSDRPLGFLVTASSLKELKYKTLYADKNIKVLDLNGKDIMQHGLYFEE